MWRERLSFDSPEDRDSDVILLRREESWVSDSCWSLRSSSATRRWTWDSMRALRVVSFWEGGGLLVSLCERHVLCVLSIVDWGRVKTVSTVVLETTYLCARLQLFNDILRQAGGRGPKCKKAARSACGLSPLSTFVPRIFLHNRRGS